MSGAKESLGSGDGETFDPVNELTSSVVSCAGVAFCVFVREDTPRSLQDGDGHEVLGRNELDILLLTPNLGLDERIDLRIHRRKRRVRV
ncbi:MAG: hypothetical protein BWY79_02171 [Actinobacteria bacterium ADurb.Bin444]|nr:MAG: hypothetical protein BWY79_02171 [Actinobacteria bacterium ADurb.Bin444]